MVHANAVSREKKGKCIVNAMKKLAFTRSTLGFSIDILKVTDMKDGQCTRVTNSGSTSLLPGVYPPGDCRIFPDSPRSVEQIQCDSKPGTSSDFQRICACTKAVDTTTATTTSITRTTTTVTTNTILDALHKRLAELESTIEDGGSSSEALVADIVGVNEALVLLDNDVQAQASTITQMQGALTSSDAKVAALEKTVADLQAAFSAMLEPPALDAPVVKTCKSGPECAPTLAADGNDIAVAAPGGRVVFSSDACEETDMCVLASQVKALMRKAGADVDDDY